MNDFQVQLKVKDEEYVKSLKQQAEDVEELLERMRTEFRELQVFLSLVFVFRSLSQKFFMFLPLNLASDTFTYFHNFSLDFV